MYSNFWDDKNDHIVKDDHGYRISEAETQVMLWDHSLMILEMYSLWLATKDQTIRAKLNAEWAFMKRSFSESSLTGNCGSTPNFGLDDTGWDCMGYMAIYHVTDDAEALNAAKTLIQNAYAYYKDGSTANGLWYEPNLGQDPTTRIKSLYAVGVVSAALDYTLASGDDSLMTDTMNVYTWIEANLRRDKVKTYQDGLQDGSPYTVSVVDNLYWCDFNVGRQGRVEKNGPDGGTRPNDIGVAGSVSYLAGNMAMGVIQARLYRLLREEEYLGLVHETVRAINDKSNYNVQGSYPNDRDPWSGGTFAGSWVAEVLTLPGVADSDRQRLFATAQSIVSNCYTSGGWWDGEWTGGVAYDIAGAVGLQMMTSASTVGVLTAAALLDRNLQH